MKNTKAFTLIELLVVVLIIGILASVALPQYQKVVERSRATQAVAMLRSLKPAFEEYYLANGTWPNKFEEVSLDVTHMKGNVAYIATSGGNVKDTLSDDDWSLQIQTDTPSSGAYYLVSMGRISGPYKGAALMLRLYTTALPESESQITCHERTTASSFIFSKPAGSYCAKIMKGTLIADNAESGRSYSLP